MGFGAGTRHEACPLFQRSLPNRPDALRQNPLAQPELAERLRAPGTLEVQSNVLLEIRQMARVPTIIPVSDLRQDAAHVLNNVKKSSEPVFITQRGRATAVLMSLDTFERSEAERELLLLLARGEKEITAGVGHPLDQVLADADSLLSDG